jgi:hypothetical protein
MKAEKVAVTGWELNLLKTSLDYITKEIDDNPSPGVLITNHHGSPREEHLDQIEDSRAQERFLIEGVISKINAAGLPFREGGSVSEFSITSDEKKLLVSSLRLITQRLGAIFVDGRWIHSASGGPVALQRKKAFLSV